MWTFCASNKDFGFPVRLLMQLGEILSESPDGQTAARHQPQTRHDLCTGVLLIHYSIISYFIRRSIISFRFIVLFYLFFYLF